MQLRMDKDIENAGAIEPTIDKLIAHRFKGRGMSWSEESEQALLKIRQTIVNNEWEDWWYKKRGKKIEIRALFKEPLTARQLCKREEIAPYIEAEIPAGGGCIRVNPG